MTLAVAMLGLALLAAALLASTIARPLKRTASEAAALGKFDFDRFEPLPWSRMSEINELAHAFNTMSVAPAAAIAAPTVRPLWLERLSRMTMAPDLISGTRTCSIKAWNALRLIGPSSTMGTTIPVTGT